MVRQRRLRDRDRSPTWCASRRAPDGGKRYVLLDTDGPGAIVRIWTATTGGTLRIYIDGDAKPAVEAPVADLLRGAVSPFVAPLAHVAARGNNLYFPFPFARHCLVTVDDIVVGRSVHREADGEALLPDRLPALSRRGRRARAALLGRRAGPRRADDRARRDGPARRTAARRPGARTARWRSRRPRFSPATPR